MLRFEDVTFEEYRLRLMSADKVVRGVSPPAAGGVEQPLDLLLKSPHGESEFGLFVIRSGIPHPTLFALLQLLAAFYPLVLVLDHHDSSPVRFSPSYPLRSSL